MIRKTLFLSVLVLANCYCLQAQSKSSDELIKILTAPQTSRKARKKAAAQLAQKPPGEVLPKLFMVRRAYGHACAGWGTDLFAAGVKVPWEAAAAMTASYAWSDNLNNLKNPKYTTHDKGTALLHLLRQQTEASVKAGLLHDLKFNWVVGAEMEAVSLLSNDKSDWRSRYIAAEVLVDKTELRYFDEVYITALSAPLENKEWFARLLLWKKSPDRKAKVLCFAFDVIRDQRETYTDRLDYGYFIASAIGDYVGVPFVPDKSDPKYKGQFSLTDSYFIETVDNALKWWDNNKSTCQD